MSITKDTVKYAANLARIEMNDKELEQITVQLGRILDYVQKLKNLNVEGLEPTSHVLEMKNVYREDTVKKSLPVEEVMKNAPEREGDLFRVAKIIET